MIIRAPISHLRRLPVPLLDTTVEVELVGCGAAGAVSVGAAGVGGTALVDGVLDTG